jgi:hypothetical protein
MAIDVYMTASGDLAISSNGDLAVTTGDIQTIEQQAILRLATQRGDYPVYPNLGASLQRLVGMPNTEKTANFGKNIIINAFARDKNLGSVTVESWPTSPSTIHFEVKVSYGKEYSVILTLDQLVVQ